jgi:hydroxymethylbilane synthase
VGQGALAVQIREGDEETAGLLSRLDDWLTRAAVTAERTLLAGLGGGCQTPIAALALPKDGDLVLNAMVATLDGKRIIRKRESDRIANAEALGERMARLLLESGAQEILEQVHSETGPTDMGAA